MGYKGQKYKRKYDAQSWTTTGANKSRNLKNLAYSLNEEDYLSTDEYDWHTILGEVIQQAIIDLARYNSKSEEYISAHNFIFGEGLDIWCIAFGVNFDTELARQKAKAIIVDEVKRADFLHHVYEQQIRQRLIRRKKQGDKDGCFNSENQPDSGDTWDVGDSGGDSELDPT